MSKKLIAVAAAAALALTGLVGISPANAAFSSPTIHQVGADSGLTSAAPLTNAANVLNTIVNAGDSSVRTTYTAVRFNFSSLVNGKVVSATTTSPTVKFLPRSTADKQTGETVNASSGSGSIDITVAGNAAQFYVYSSSTTTASFTVSYEGNTTVYYIKSLAGAPYNVAVTFPASIGASQTGDILAKVTDRAGNELKGDEGAAWIGNSAAASKTLLMSVIGEASVVGLANGGSFTYSVARSAWVGKISASASGGPIAATVTLGAEDLSSVGFAKPVTSAFGSLTAADLTALTAQVAALQATIANMRTKANSVTKKRWNKLVRAHRALGGTAKLK